MNEDWMKGQAHLKSEQLARQAHARHLVGAICRPRYNDSLAISRIIALEAGNSTALHHGVGLPAEKAKE